MRVIAFFIFLILSGCASVQVPGYISRVDHPYDRKIYGSFEKLVSAVTYVLKVKGWDIAEESEPSVYESDDRYDNNGFQNLLIISKVKRQNLVLYTVFSHLNVFIHCFNNSCDVEIRYEASKSLVKKFTSVRNDQLVDDLLDAIEQEVNK